MLRVHLTAQDVSRTRILATYGPLAETLFSVAAIHHPGYGAHGVLLEGWRRSARHGAQAWLRGLDGMTNDLVTVDLFTVIGIATTLDEGSQALLAAKPARLHAELDGAVAKYTRSHLVAPAGLLALARRAADARGTTRQLAASLRACHDTTVGPYWQRMRAYLETELAARARTMAAGGVDALLGTLHPAVRWRPPVLEMQTEHGPSRDLHLGGRGLLVVPCIYAPRLPEIYLQPADPAMPATLFYPAVRDVRDAAWLLAPPHPRTSSQRLAALLGRTRAAALEAVGDPCSTSQLAERLHVSVATASEHAAVLRDAGLLATRRQGSTVVHSLTPLGASLLNGNVHRRETARVSS